VVFPQTTEEIIPAIPLNDRNSISCHTWTCEADTDCAHWYPLHVHASQYRQLEIWYLTIISIEKNNRWRTGPTPKQNERLFPHAPVVPFPAGQPGLTNGACRIAPIISSAIISSWRSLVSSGSMNQTALYTACQVSDPARLRS